MRIGSRAHTGSSPQPYYTRGAEVLHRLTSSSHKSTSLQNVSPRTTCECLQRIRGGKVISRSLKMPSNLRCVWVIVESIPSGRDRVFNWMTAHSMIDHSRSRSTGCLVTHTRTRSSNTAYVVPSPLDLVDCRQTGCVSERGWSLLFINYRTYWYVGGFITI